VGGVVRGERKSAKLFRKRERVQGSRDRESAEGSETSVVKRWRIFIIYFYLFCPRWCSVRVRVKDGRGDAEMLQWTLG